MSLSVGDHLVIKREGKILTPDSGESYHEFEVVKYESIALVDIEGKPLERNSTGYRVVLKVIR